MSVNTANTPDGRGVLIYNGEMILLYTQEVNCHFEDAPDHVFKGDKCGNLYLTSHRIIFINRKNDDLRSFSIPFHCMKNVKLEQPLFGANFLIGTAISQPGGNWNGQVTWKLSFGKGGCIDFGHALLKAADMAQRFRPYDAPPAYAPPSANYFAAPPSYYIPPGGNYNGLHIQTDIFPDYPPTDNVYMYEAPPPYTGIGPDHPVPAVLVMQATNEQQESAGSFPVNTAITVSDYNQNFRNSANNGVAQISGCQTVCTDYHTPVECPGMMNTAVAPVSTLASFQQPNQVSPTTTVTPASQFEHVTMMTNLQQPLSGVCAGIPVSSVTDETSYVTTSVNAPSSVNTGGLQICPPSSITQQVQQSVPAINSLSTSSVQSRREYGVQRPQTFRSIRAKTTNPAILPLARGCSRQLANITAVSNDGPTVRQHLQQQHKVRLQQQMALQERMRMDKDEFGGDYLKVLSPSVDKTLPISNSLNLPTSSTASVSVSTPVTIPASPSMNVPSSLPINLPAVSQGSNMVRPPQMQRQYVPRTSAQRLRNATDRTMQMQKLDQTSHDTQKHFSQSSEIHNQAIQRAAAVYNHVKAHTEALKSGSIFKQLDNAHQSFAAVGTNEASTDVVQKKSPTRKRSLPRMSASQVRVTVLGTQSEPATQQILTESDRVLPIHGIGPRFKQSRMEMVDQSFGKDGALQNAEQKQPLQFIRTTHNAVSINASQTIGDCLKSDIGMDPPNAQKPFIVPISGNNFNVPVHSTEAVSTELLPTTDRTGLMLPSISRLRMLDDSMSRLVYGNAAMSMANDGPGLNTAHGNAGVDMTTTRSGLSMASCSSAANVAPASSGSGMVAGNSELLMMTGSVGLDVAAEKSGLNMVQTNSGSNMVPSSSGSIVISGVSETTGVMSNTSKQTALCGNSGPNAVSSSTGLNVASGGGVLDVMPDNGGISLASDNSSLAPAYHIHSGNTGNTNESSLGTAVDVQTGLANYMPDGQQEYDRKLYFMKRMIESLVIKNSALCDEVSRLNQRIQTVMEERKVLAKRLQHHERNRIRRIQTKLKKQAAAQAIKANDSPTIGGAEGENLAVVNAEIDESDDSEKTVSSNDNVTPNTSASISRVETPEPVTRCQDILKQAMESLGDLDGGKCKSKNGIRRHHSAKQFSTNRKDKKLS